MNIKNKEPIQAALDSLEMALENMENKEEYTLNDIDIKDIWDIWEEASHQLGMADDKEELKHFADGFHEGRWEDDIEQRYTHDGDGKPYTVDIHGNEYDPTKMSDGQHDFSEDDLIG